MSPAERKFHELREKAREFARAAEDFIRMVDGMPGFSSGCAAIECIQETTAEFYKAHVAAMSTRSRVREDCDPRMVAIALSKDLTRHSQAEIARCFGGRTHGAVINAVRVIANRRETEADFRKEYEVLRRKCERQIANIETPLFATGSEA
jgi:Bacterial dnaA protein helix-turn-helix